MSKNVLYSLLFGLPSLILAPIFMVACFVSLVTYAFLRETRDSIRDFAFSATEKSPRPSRVAT